MDNPILGLLSPFTSHPSSELTWIPDTEGNSYSVTFSGVTYWVPDPRNLSLVQAKDL